MEIKIEEKFPCGYEKRVQVKAWNMDLEDVVFGKCPFHGKNCPKDIKKGEKKK